MPTWRILAGRFSAELNRRQVLPGERVVIWGGNSAEWIAAFFGCLLRGVLAVPLDSSGTSEFAARVIADVEPRLVVGDRSLVSTLAVESPILAFSDFQKSLPVDPLFDVDPAVSSAVAHADHLYLGHDFGAQGCCSYASQCAWPVWGRSKARLKNTQSMSGSFTLFAFFIACL